MSLHPLTPRKQTGAARVAAWSVGIAVFALGLTLLLQLSSPTAWLPLANRAQDADLSFLASLVAHEYRSALGEVFPLAMLSAFIELPASVAADFVGTGIAPSLLIRGSAAVIAGAIVGIAVYKAMLAGKVTIPAVQHVKGLKLVAGKAAHASLRASWRNRYGTTTSGIALTGGLEMPPKLLEEHMFIVGGTGAGKSTVIQAILGSAIAAGERVLLVDPKGDLTARLPTDSFALLSLDDVRSMKLALDDDIETSADAAELFEEIIPDTNDPSWSSGTRQVGQAVIERFQHRKRRTGQIWGWRSLQKLLSRPIEDIHAFVAAQSSVAGAIIDVTHNDTRKAAMSFYLVLVANALAIISACGGMGRADADRLSVRRWLNGEGPQVLILRQSQRHPKRSAAFIRIVLKIAADAVAERAAHVNPPPVWFALDELAQIGATPAIPRLAAIGRSASVRILGAVQGPSQLTELYGDDGAQTILDNMTTKIVGRVAPGAAAADISERWIGSRTVSWWEKTGYDANGKPKTERKTQDVPVVPSEFLSNELGLRRDVLDRPFVRALVLGHGDIALLEWPVGQWSIRRPAAITQPTTDDV